VRLVLALMAGTEGPGRSGPHVTICNARGAHNISTAEWTVSAILATLKYFPLYLDIQLPVIGAAAPKLLCNTSASTRMIDFCILP